MQRAREARMQHAVVERVLRPAESAFWGALDRASSWMARVEAWVSEVRRTPWGHVALPGDGAGPPQRAPADASPPSP